MSIIVPKPAQYAARPLPRISGLDDDNAALLQTLYRRLQHHAARNTVLEGYYDGSAPAPQLHIAKPPELQHFNAVSGWPAIVVDVLEERLEWEGWRGGPTYLDDVYEHNNLRAESTQAHLEALLHGVSFLRVGAGDADQGEPETLVTVESPKSTTGILDLRTRRLSSGLSVVIDESGGLQLATLMLPDSTITLEASADRIRVVDRYDHGLGRVPLVPIVNRRRAGQIGGASEITPAIRYLRDNAMRTLEGMEINREFYSTPQRWAMGVSERDFVDGDGNAVSKWEAIAGKIWAMERDENGNTPTVGQFTPSSPTPYLEQVRGLAQLVAAEAGIPTHYLGMLTDNPASADAIRAGEARLVKRAERRQMTFAYAWSQVANLIAASRGDADGALGSVASAWRDPSTPTAAAQADATHKLVDAGILPRGSEIAARRAGLSADEIAMMKAELEPTDGPSGSLATVLNRVAGTTEAPR